MSRFSGAWFGVFVFCVGVSGSAGTPSTYPAQGSANLADVGYSVRFDGSAHRAVNRAQEWSAEFESGGFTIRPSGSAESWGLGFCGFERGTTRSRIDAPLRSAVTGPRFEYAWSEGVTEWFVNRANGLEHGLTIEAPPLPHEPSGAKLVLEFESRGSLTAHVDANGLDVRVVGPRGESMIDYLGLHVFDAAGATLEASFVVAGDRLRLTIDDLDAHYPITVDPVAQKAYLKASNTDPSDRFGFSVAVSGDTVVIGAPKEDGNATTVNGNGDSDSAADAGAAYVFTRTGTVWTQQAYLKPSNADAGDEFGFSVAIDADTIVVGAPYEASNADGIDGDGSNDLLPDSGAAYVFTRSGTTWSQQAYLKASNSLDYAQFGAAVAIDGETVVVGADRETSPVYQGGTIYVFTRSGATWSQQAALKPAVAGVQDHFGFAVAISGESLLVGAPDEDGNATTVNGDASNNGASDSGAAYVFTRSGVAWTQQAYLKPNNTDLDDLFGWSVGIFGDRVIIGAPGEDGNATTVNGDGTNDSAVDAGAAYVFHRSGSTWTLHSYLKANNTGSLDEFGFAVALSGDEAIVGAPGEDSNATGLAGNGTNESASASGAAYSFQHGAGSWTIANYMKASNTDANDGFGFAVALDAGRSVVGAAFESSAATGVNGNASNNSASQAGASYLFDSTPSTISLAWQKVHAEAKPSVFKRFADKKNTKKYNNLVPFVDLKDFEVRVTDGGLAPPAPVTLRISVSGDSTGTGHEQHGKPGASGTDWYHGWLFDTKKPKAFNELKTMAKNYSPLYGEAGGCFETSTIDLGSKVIGRGEITITTNPEGVATFRYVPPELASTDTVLVEATSEGGIDPIETDIVVRTAGFVKLEDSSDGAWTFYDSDVAAGNPAKHVENRSGTPAMLDALRDAALEYRDLQTADTQLTSLKAQLAAKSYTFSNDPLQINDMSLPMGGLMDAKGNGASPHGFHRWGVNADIRSKHLVANVANSESAVGDPMVTDKDTQKLIKKAQSRQFLLLVQALQTSGFKVAVDEVHHLHITLKT